MTLTVVDVIAAPTKSMSNLDTFAMMQSCVDIFLVKVNLCNFSSTMMLILKPLIRGGALACICGIPTGMGRYAWRTLNFARGRI